MDAKIKKARGRPRQRPDPTVKGREDQLISLAIDVAQEQLSSRTASAQVITHFLKLGTTKMELEKEKLRQENLLLEARTEALQSAKRIEFLYEQALKAMRQYGGQVNEDGELDDEE